MGLDTVELVMEIEEAFGIRFRDEDLEQIQTVGQVYEFLLERLPAGSLGGPTVCLSAVSFYRIRRGLMSVLGVPRGAVQPATRTESLLPCSGRKDAWAALATSTQLELPPLVRPEWLCWSLAASVVAVSVMVGFAAAQALPTPLAVVLGILQLLIASALAVRLSRPFATRLPRNSQTVRSFAWSVAASNTAALEATYRDASSRRVWEKLKLLIIKQLGVLPEDVTLDASFVNDFGCD